ncbi:MAG: plastocyanin/azurin family copper-binding protein [Armatimonadota bacterium]|nr:plastocyanin/azurin family copper-binding protein [Armatimonadota bacterium]MDR7437725.1 plastocyanin/azurin family copper-binding protein [Armatimonadota bacterium]MDR7471870.1 plastocyanin/azurin family copper-binding protein [Armatimonadota bacterium]MDR7507270.1 plastocyanin/azurin family copper-binding protein [Armatimonadota bacterium]MDR7509879.1 plastocyanin/azurin family copper-binding protein [Armatimonadota bacterium]
MKPSATSCLERVAVDPEQTVSIRFAAKKTGTSGFACHMPGHYGADMKGTLTVT